LDIEGEGELVSLPHEENSHIFVARPESKKLLKEIIEKQKLQH
jgi:hypothetical protein